MCAQPVEPAGWPTRSPYRIEPDEGPQTIAELKAALAPWPPELMAFTARLEAARFEEIRALVAEYRMVWLSRAHPVIRAAERASQDASAPAVSWDEVMADYDDDFQLRPDAAVREQLRDGGAAR